MSQERRRSRDQRNLQDNLDEYFNSNEPSTNVCARVLGSHLVECLTGGTTSY